MATMLEQARNIRHMLVSAAEVLSDADALNVPYAFNAWGEGVAYSVGDRVRYGTTLYKCVQAHTSQADWAPADTPALWVRVFVEEWPEWIQPAGAADAYEKGSKVSHAGGHWISSVDANVWEPGVYGWEQA